MAALEIEGVAYDVLLDGARRLPPRKVGTTTPAFSGKLRRTERAVFDTWEFSLLLHNYAAVTALKASAAAGKRTITGDLVGGGPIECFVDVEDVRYDEDEEDGIFAIASVIIHQAE